MPNRMFREGFVDSESVAALSDWAHRVYSNLLIKSDNAGRYDGRLAILRATLFPLGTSRRTEDFSKALSEMESPKAEDGTVTPPLIIRYEFAGKPYIQITKFQRVGSDKDAFYPWRDGSYRIDYVVIGSRGDDEKSFVKTSLAHPVATPSLPGSDPVLPKETDTKTDTKTKRARVRGSDVMPPIPESLNTPEFVEAWDRWQRHRQQKRSKLTPLAAEEQLKDCEAWGPTRAVAAIRFSISKGWQGLFESKNGRHEVPVPDAPPQNRKYAS